MDGHLPPSGAQGRSFGARIHLPHAEQINTVRTQDVFDWLAAGWRDLTRGGATSVLYGGVFALAGYAIAFGLAEIGHGYLLLPVAAAFTLVAPVLAIGFYQISKRIESGERVSLRDAITAPRANAFHIMTAGLVLMLFALIWVRVATLIFALMFPASGLSADAMLMQLATPAGLVFLAAAAIIGGAFAATAFLFCAISLPMMLDRPGTDFFTSALVSMQAVLRNPRAMALWAAIIAVTTIAGIATFFVGLIIVMPLIGHASWHAYRALIAHR
jgi:uncharacterized membrane protein